MATVEVSKLKKRHKGNTWACWRCGTQDYHYHTSFAQAYIDALKLNAETSKEGELGEIIICGKAPVNNRLDKGAPTVK